MLMYWSYKLSDHRIVSRDRYGNYAGDLAEEAALPCEDGRAEGDEEQDVPSRSPPMDGRLAGYPLELAWQAVDSTS